MPITSLGVSNPGYVVYTIYAHTHTHTHTHTHNTTHNTTHLVT